VAGVLRPEFLLDHEVIPTVGGIDKIFRHGLVLTAGGVVIGLAAPLALTRFMSTLLFGVSASDLVTFMSVPALLAGLALAASYLPARRATLIDPMVALRDE
jgi:putative ABC transport system permease protein